MPGGRLAGCHMVRLLLAFFVRSLEGFALEPACLNFPTINACKVYCHGSLSLLSNPGEVRITLNDHSPPQPDPIYSTKVLTKRDFLLNQFIVVVVSLWHQQS